MMNVEPRSEHVWLRKMLGEWVSEADCPSETGEPQKTKGSESVRSLGGLWVVAEGEGEMPGGGEARMLMTLGFDPEKERFIGTWAGSMMTHMWIYEGRLDESGKVLTLDTTGPNFSKPGTTAAYQDIITFLSDDHRTLTSRVRGEDGGWTQIMQADYRRKK